MPQLERWDRLPEGVRQYLIERMRNRAISISDLNHLRLWVESALKYPTVTGTSSEGKLQRVKPSYQRAFPDSSSVVA